MKKKRPLTLDSLLDDEDYLREYYESVRKRQRWNTFNRVGPEVCFALAMICVVIALVMMALGH